ncbi:Spo0E family sporulation regulatory protein-aspartic acid phosphatase [Thermoanaerobacter mathranii]|uniref:Spo0E family sporulation regulatory protein-aspartic acid phosphatase n=1 Tax=Thermoanaerobacter mathranii TaxID=583357 RepID=UPI003AAD070C
MEKVIKEHYYEENDIAERIKFLKKKLNESNLELPKSLELSRELDELIVMYMKKEKQVKQVK